LITRNSWRWLLALVSLAIALVTLTPADVPDDALARTPWWCLVCGDQGIVDVLLNVLLFIPFGITLRGSGAPIRSLGAVGLAVTILIECAQGLVIPGRDPSLSDVLTNTTGAVVGAWLMPFGPRILAPAPRLAAGITLAATALFLIQATGSAVLFRPAPISSPTYETQWSQVFPGTVPFRGEVISAEAMGLPLPPGRIDSTESLIKRLSTPPTFVSVEVEGAAGVRARAQIVALHDGDANIITWFNQNRCTIEFRLRLAPATFRLNYPAVATLIPCDLEANRLRIEGRMTHRALSVFVTDLASGQVWSSTLSAGPNLAWSYLIPGYRAYHQKNWPSGAWVMMWVAVLGYFARFGQRLWWVAVPGGAVFVALVLLPATLGLVPVSLIEWAGAAFGGAAGCAAAQWIRRRERRVETAG
jgi:hypothetical protein